MSSIPALSAFNGIKISTTYDPADAIAIPAGRFVGTSPISGYTKLTPFTCSLNLSSGITQNDVTNFYNLIWWFGDGTYSTEYSPSHVYQWPGIYEVKVGLFNFNTSFLSVSSTASTDIENLIVQIGTDAGNLYNFQTNGVQPVTFSGTVTAFNFINDGLSWNYTEWSDLSGTQASLGRNWHGYQSSKSGDASGPKPLAFDYVTNITDCEDVQFSFFAENSLSQPWTEVPQSQFTNFRPRWRFTTASATSLSAESVITEYSPLTCTEIRVLSSGQPSSTGTLIGLSGTIYFYYIDDIPSQVISLGDTGAPTASAQLTTLWVTLNTFNVKDPQTLQYSTYNSYSNTTTTLSSYYYVKSLRPHHLEISLDGQLPLPTTYWIGSESKFAVTINSPVVTGTQDYISNKILLNYPLNVFNVNNGRYFSVAVGSSATSLTPQVSARFNSSSSTPTVSNYLNFAIQRYDSVGRDTGGYYLGSFTPYSLSGRSLSSVCLSAYTSNVPTTSSTPPVSSMFFVTDFDPANITGYNPALINTTNWILSSVYLSGCSNKFAITNFNSEYFTRKKAGNFDYGALLKTYALQPTINQNEVLFDDYLSSIAGTSATNADTFGGVVYEKIANYVSNSSDPHTANLAQFYALTEILGEEINTFNYNAPGSLQRIIDLYTVPQSHVWGSRSTFARNFSNAKNHTNLGTALTAYNIATALVTAGQKIVINDLFDTEYFELIEVPRVTSYAAASARGMGSYFSPAATYPMSVYPLSAFFGWGLKTPISQNYRVFYYVDVVDNSQVEGLVNWDDTYTTLSENASGYSEWIKDGGTLEKIFNYYIHKGLGFTQ